MIRKFTTPVAELKRILKYWSLYVADGLVRHFGLGQRAEY